MNILWPGDEDTGVFTRQNKCKYSATYTADQKLREHHIM